MANLRNRIRKLLRENIIFSLILIVAFGYRHFQSKEVENGLTGKSLSELKVYSLEKNKTLEIKDIPGDEKTLYLWATWCPPCRLQNKILDFYELIGLETKGKIIKISVDQDLKILKKYLVTNSYENHFIESTNLFFRENIIRGTPTILKLNQKGEVTAVKMGINFFF